MLQKRVQKAVQTATKEGMRRYAHYGAATTTYQRLLVDRTSWLPMVWGDYWIVRLQGDYQYSLVGTPDRKYLWVLSRDERADKAVVDELLAYAKALGFPVDKVVKP